MVLRQENGTTCAKQQLSLRLRGGIEISVFGRSAPEKRGGPKMSFASWPSINHASASAPPFDPRPTDRPRGARPRPSPPLSAPTIAIAAAVVVVCRKEEEEAIFFSSPTNPLVQIGNEAQGLARPPLTSLHFGCFCEPLYLGERGGRLHQPAPVLPHVCCIC